MTHPRIAMTSLRSFGTSPTPDQPAQTNELTPEVSGATPVKSSVAKRDKKTLYVPSNKSSADRLNVAVAPWLHADVLSKVRQVRRNSQAGQKQGNRFSNADVVTVALALLEKQPIDWSSVEGFEDLKKQLNLQ